MTRFEGKYSGRLARFLGCGVLLLALCGLVAPAHGDVRMLTEPAPPTAFEQDGKLQGLGVELVRALIERTGTPADIQLMPWTRAYNIAQREADVGLFATIRTPERESRFQWVGPIMQGTVRFYSLKSSQLQLNDLADVAASGPLIVPKQWYIYEVLRDMGFDNLYGVPTPETMVNLFRHGRASLIPLEDIALAQMLEPAGLKPEDVEPHMAVMQTAYYIAFSLGTDPALVAAWQEELAKMRQDGSFSAISRQWLAGTAQPDAAQ